MARYAFLTTWILDAPHVRVWEAIHDVEAWPRWWRGVRTVARRAEGDADGIGAVYAHEWRSVIPYPVRFETTITRIEPPHLIEAEARGELEGTGRWRLYGGAGETVVTYDWNVRTTRPWMNAVAPVARPVFRWNHNAVMHRGGEGLAELLGARLLAVT